MAGKKRVGEGASAGPSTSSSQKRPHSTTFLPSWVESASRSSYTLNKSMPSLENRYNALKKWIPELKKEQMAHVSGGYIYCPCMALAGKKIVHSSNGTYVAVMGDVLYANCSDMSCTWNEVAENQEDHEMLLVKGTESFGHPWVRYTEDNYTRLATRG